MPSDWLRRHWVQPLVVSYVCVHDFPFRVHLFSFPEFVNLND